MAKQQWNTKVMMPLKFEKGKQFLCAHMPYFRRPGHKLLCFTY